MPTESLARDDREWLLLLARGAIRQRLGEEALPHDPSRLSSSVIALRGAFVTLCRAATRELRGCVGCLEANRPLWRRVLELAPRAAFEDPRFPPLGAGELQGVRIAISVTSPLERIHGPREIVLGRDGVELRRGERHAVFLPQVASEQGWSVTELVAHLAEKAGMPRDGWREAELSVFRTDTFREGEDGQGPSGCESGGKSGA